MTSNAQSTSKQPSSTQSRQQTLQQERAASAWEHVQRVKQNLKEYTPLVRGAPATVLRDGLAPTLAFYGAKGASEHKQLLGHLNEWTKKQLKFKEDALLQYLLQCSSADYRQATTEALAYLVWLKRFAEALNDGKEHKG
jgi:CRISPR-associated protein Cmr5